MLIRRLIPFLLAVTLVAASCGGDAITATNCYEISDETMKLFQRLIDDVDTESGDMTVEEYVATGGELPSLQHFSDDAQKIDDLAVELGCSQTEISESVAERTGELTAESDLGRFLIHSIRAGGI